MTFLHPEFLYLMLPPVLVLFYFLLTQAEVTARFFSPEVYDRLRVNTKMMTLRARNGLFLLMFLFFILAMAQPVIEEGKVTVKAKSADIMVALDISDSMRAEDVYPTRLERGKRKIMELLERSPQERIGVSAFAKEAYLVAPLSFDHRAVSFLVQQLQPEFITEKGTDFLQLLRAAAEMMRENDRKYLLILSDGGDAENFDEAIALAKEEGIKVFVLGIGTLKGAPVKSAEGGFVKVNGDIVISKLNEAVVQLATQTGGSYIESVASNEDVEAMLEEITAKTRRRSLKEEEITRYGQLFYWPLGAGMLLLLIATSSMSRRERVHLPLSAVIAVVSLQAVPAEAGLMDFTLLDGGKSAYEAGDYNRSAASYEAYAKRHHSDESRYNAADAYYRAGRFEEAAKTYESTRFADAEKQFDTLHNLGNAYARVGTTESLEKSVQAYQKALELKEDPLTRENLETVKKMLQKQQQPQPSQGEGKQPPKDSKPDEKQQGEKGASSKKQEDQQQQGNESQEKGNTQPQQQEANERDSGTDRQKKSAQSEADKKQQEAAAKSEKEASGEKRPETQNSEQHKSDKSAEAAEAGSAKAEAKEGNAPEVQMSDLEAQKWLKMLNDRPVSHIYRIGPEEEPKTKGATTDEKPW